MPKNDPPKSDNTIWFFIGAAFAIGFVLYVMLGGGAE